ncbi:MAG: hypothetical protein ACR2GG_05395 [Gemmatimonadaceae bacterium]
MTTSRQTENLGFADIRALIDAAHTLPLNDRTTLLKGLIPSIAGAMSPEDFDAFMLELRLKGRRWYEAAAHPGEGSATREIPGERSVEGR